MIDLIVRGGQVVLSDQVVETDIAVAEGKVLALGAHRAFHPARRTLDVHGCLVFPGAIDPHVHVRWPFLNDTTGDRYEDATIAAARGGTTTIIDYALTRENVGPLEALRDRRAQAEGQAVVDYAFHCVITRVTPQVLAEMAGLMEAGVPTFKMYMAYSRRGIMVDDASLYQVARWASQRAAMLMVHGENGLVADLLEAEFLRDGKGAACYYPLFKPDFVEAEAVQRAVFWASVTQARLYVVHLSTQKALESVQQAQRRGARIYAETCPQYLVLDDTVYQRSDGHRFICSPPIRTAADADALWKGLQEGAVATIGSDHCAFSRAQKDRDAADFSKVPNGLPGVETRFPLLFSAGVSQGRLTPVQLARVTSTNVARVHGLFPRKGIIAPGSDADMVIVDPSARQTLSAQSLHMVSDWSPYEGLELRGYPAFTIARGQVIVEGGEFRGEVGTGRFVPRSLSVPGGP